MLLVIDVGNTNIVLGVYDDKDLVGHWRISTDRVRTTDEYGMLMMNLFFHDRIVNAVAANAVYKGPLIIIDFGTATTYCAVLGNGDYIGGVITPGVTISAEALFQRAAKLPRIEVKDPGQVINRNTVSSMQSGMFYGYVGQVEGLVSRMKAEMGGDVTVVATGGLAQLISSATDCIDHVEPMLTLEGLRLIYERNK